MHTLLSTKVSQNPQRDWKVGKLISCSNNVKIYETTSIPDSKKAILKVIPAALFNKSQYKMLQTLPQDHLCTPFAYFHKNKSVFLLYSHLTTLENYLCENTLSLTDLLLMGQHLSQGIRTLLSCHWKNIDISPGNIYVSSNGSYLLGDISLCTTTITTGTPGFIPPEFTKKNISVNELMPTSSSCQYSIGRVLLYFAQNGVFPSSMEQVSDYDSNPFYSLIKTCCATCPDKRFSSLQDFENMCVSLRKNPAIQNNTFAFRLSDISQKGFYVRTELLSQKADSKFHASSNALPKSKKVSLPFLSVLVFLCGCLFLLSLYHYLHPANTKISSDSFINNTQETIYTSSPHPVKVSVPTSQPASKSSISMPKEYDWQNKELSALSSLSLSKEQKNNVQCLYLGNNTLRSLSGISAYSNLQELYVNENKLTDCSSLQNLTKLNILVLSYNELIDINNFISCQSLTYLDLSHTNKILHLMKIKKLKNLKTLNLQGVMIPLKKKQELIQYLPQCQILF